MVAIAMIEAEAKLFGKVNKWIDNQSDYEFSICETSTGRFFEKLDLSAPPDIVIMDLFTKDGSTLDHFQKLKRLLPTARFMLYTENIDEETLYLALQQGFSAVKLKRGRSREFTQALHLLSCGEVYIDPTLMGSVVKLIRRKPTENEPAEAELEQFQGLLNQREMQVVKGLTKGKQYKEIATDLYISINTVRHYVKSVYRKFGVNNRVQLMRKVGGSP